MTSTLPNPLIPGFNPDPSIAAVDGKFYLVTSTFEYLPGIPVYESTDLVAWTQIGNVAIDPAQLRVENVPTFAGVWAPTIRFHDGLFYVIVTVMMSPVGCVVFTSADPRVGWSAGTTIEGLDGIDPDLVWDADGNAYVTYSALRFDADSDASHAGIEQVRVDLDTGRILDGPNGLWSGTGLHAPEAPHVYRRGEYWYLLIAEGGTQRGHSVSVARGPSPSGPFQGFVDNPVLSARSTSRLVQNTGHGDLIELPDGDSAMVLLGVRPIGAAASYSPLGRETFITRVDWRDGWPHPAPVHPAPGPGVSERFSFPEDAGLSNPGWLAVRQIPTDIGSRTDAGLTIHADGRTLADPAPAFVGRRQRHLRSDTSVEVDVSRGSGGLALRYSERAYLSIGAQKTPEGTTVTVTAVAGGLTQQWSLEADLPTVTLRIETIPLSMLDDVDIFAPESPTADRIRLSVDSADKSRVIAEIDGRHWTSEVLESFTGRVTGMYADQGSVVFSSWAYVGDDRV